MKYQTSNPIMKQRGFTIIEVALVLAIAGLIFVVIFLAFPALQNSQKDTTRKQDVARVISALQSYTADHEGVVQSPTAWAWANSAGTSSSDTFGIGRYLDKLSSGINGAILAPANYGGNMYAATPANSRDVYSGLLCPSSSNNRTATSSDAAVVVILSNSSPYCTDM